MLKKLFLRGNGPSRFAHVARRNIFSHTTSDHLIVKDGALHKGGKPLNEHDFDFSLVVGKMVGLENIYAVSRQKTDDPEEKLPCDAMKTISEGNGKAIYCRNWEALKESLETQSFTRVISLNLRFPEEYLSHVNMFRHVLQDTDSVFVAVVSEKGWTNEPNNMVHIAKPFNSSIFQFALQAVVDESTGVQTWPNCTVFIQTFPPEDKRKMEDERFKKKTFRRRYQKDIEFGKKKLRKT